MLARLRRFLYPGEGLVYWAIVVALLVLGIILLWILAFGAESKAEQETLCRQAEQLESGMSFDECMTMIHEYGYHATKAILAQ